MECGAQTASGQSCKRRVREEGRRCPCHTETGDQCSICYSQMTQQTTRELPCHHKFHSRCIERWKRTSRTCPMCREPFDQPEYRVMISIQCVRTGDRGIDQYLTTNVTGLEEAFNLNTHDLINGVRRTTYNIDFETEYGQVLDEILRELGIARFRLPGPNTENPT